MSENIEPLDRIDSAEQQVCIEPAPSTEQFVADALRGVEEGKKAEEKKDAEELGRYVYCIIPSHDKKSFGNIGIKGSEVYTLPVGNMAAVLSNLPVKDYKEELEDNAVVHDQVVKRIMVEYTVIPIALGQVFRDDNILKAVLEKVKEDIERTFKTIEGGAEFGIKVFLPEGQTLDEEAFAQDIKKFRDIAVSVKLGKRFDRRIALNAFYLVKEGRRGEFAQAVDGLQKKYGQFNIKFTGPWPPYNFVDIKIGRGE